MSSEETMLLVVGAAMFPTVILAAVAVKLWEVRRVKRWPQTEGKVIANLVQSHRNKPGDIRHNFSDTEVSNHPLVEYEYTVEGKTCRCSRITVGERVSARDLEATLDRYPVGAPVTVFYDPADPKRAVLERDLPAAAFLGVGCLLALFIGGPLVAAAVYFGAVDWLGSNLANPDLAPFVAAAGGFGLVALLFSLAFHWHVLKACQWPTARGTVLASGEEKFRARYTDERVYWRTVYKPGVVYVYEVNGRQYTGDRLTIGVVMSATLPYFAKRAAAKYPVGREVDVYYNPDSPGESVLRPRSPLQHLTWLVAAVPLGLAWAVATGRM